MQIVISLNEHNIFMKKILTLLLLICLTSPLLSQENNRGPFKKKPAIHSKNINKKMSQIQAKSNNSIVTPVPVTPSRQGYNPGFGVNRLTFINFNYGYSPEFQSSFGATIGQYDNQGWYINVMSGLNFDAMTAELECDQYGAINGETQYYSGETSVSNISISAGILFKLIEPIAFKLGVGYGSKSLAWRTSDNTQWVRNTFYSSNGIEATAGFHIFANQLNISFDYISNNFKTYEFKLGIGININK